MLLEINTVATLTSLAVFLLVIILLVIVLLIAKRYLVASGNVKITLNGEKEVEAAAGGSLLNAMANAGVFPRTDTGTGLKSAERTAEMPTRFGTMVRPTSSIS